MNLYEHFEDYDFLCQMKRMVCSCQNPKSSDDKLDFFCTSCNKPFANLLANVICKSLLENVDEFGLPLTMYMLKEFKLLIVRYLRLLQRYDDGLHDAAAVNFYPSPSSWESSVNCLSSKHQDVHSRERLGVPQQDEENCLCVWKSLINQQHYLQWVQKSVC